MAVALHLFETEAEFNALYNGAGYSEPWVSYTEDAERVDYNKAPGPENEYFTFKILSAGTVVWKANNSAYTTQIEYSKNSGETWTSIRSTTDGASFNVDAGDTVFFRGNNGHYSSATVRYNCFAPSTAVFDVRGNIMSLINETDFRTLKTLTDDYTFLCLFRGCTTLNSAEHLVLPATALTPSCYQQMFWGCTSLIAAPELPATALANLCYSYMFNGCTSLTTAPALPATTLADNCYSMMFTGCTALLKSPELPATDLPNGCYSSMFMGCTALTDGPSVFAGVNLIGSSCCHQMFYNCKSLVNVPAILPATALTERCYSYMFYGCSSLTRIPVLPSETLVTNCYQNMNEGCTRLNYVKAMFLTTPGYSYTYNWMSGVASGGTFVKNSAATWTNTGSNSVPSSWSIETAAS